MGCFLFSGICYGATWECPETYDCSFTNGFLYKVGVFEPTNVWSGSTCGFFYFRGTYPDYDSSSSSGENNDCQDFDFDFETFALSQGNGPYWGFAYDTVTKEGRYYQNIYRHNAFDWSENEFLIGITITAPVNGSTITTFATNLEVSWTGIDSDYWTNLKIAFNDYQIGETSKIYDKELDADSGSFSIPLATFEITKNGLWTLSAIVENETEINFDIANPTYALTFDVEGLATPYAFTGWEDWYDANVENYEAPTEWATAMVGFLEPIFEKIGEFGNRITSYLNISNAYEKGFQIGGVFPVVIAYISKIDLFFGGFPIVQFFQWAILIMIGLFAVKVILKLLSFIPLFGGGG